MPAFPPLYADRANRLTVALHQLQQHQQPVSSTRYPPRPPAGDIDPTTTTTTTIPAAAFPVKLLFDHELVYPSRFGNFLSASVHRQHQPPLPSNATSASPDTNNTITAGITPPLPDQRLVCYLVATSAVSALQTAAIPSRLCTHLHIGQALVQSDQLLAIDAPLSAALRTAVQSLRSQNPTLRILLWVGGGGADANEHFAAMVRTHASRMRFVRSVLAALAAYQLDGVDLDWEFPSAALGRRERQHFVQLLHELRRAYQRSRRTYLLAVAAAAPESLAYMAYDVREIDQYVDYVNLMAYDFHMWNKWTPFTGLNAPLRVRPGEDGYLAQLNVAASVEWWRGQGLSGEKLVVGLPTYGHSFK